MTCIVCDNVSNMTYNGMSFCSVCFDSQKNTLNVYETTHELVPTVPVCVLPSKLYIGDRCSAISEEVLNQYGITHIIVAGRGLKNVVFPTKSYLFLEIDDSLEQNMKVPFKLANKFILEATGNVLVHCYSGISRSASIVLSYMIDKCKMSYENAYDKLYSVSPRIHPNSNFVKQLRELQTN